MTGFVCACTHYPVFKEPTPVRPGRPDPCVHDLYDRREGNLLRLLDRPILVNPKNYRRLRTTFGSESVRLDCLADAARPNGFHSMTHDQTGVKSTVLSD